MADTTHVITADSVDVLADVDTTTAAPTAGQILTWDGTNWTPAVPGDDDFRAIGAADGSTVTFAGDKRTDGNVGIGRDPANRPLEVEGDIHYTANLRDSADESGITKTNLGLLTGTYGTKQGKVLENQGATDAWMAPRGTIVIRVPALSMGSANATDIFTTRSPFEFACDEMNVVSTTVRVAQLDMGVIINGVSDLMDDGGGNNYMTINAGGFAAPPGVYFRDVSNEPIATASIVLNAGTGLIRRGDLVGILTGPNTAIEGDVIVTLYGRILETPHT